MFLKKTRLYAIVDQSTCLMNHVLVYDFVKILQNCGVEIIQYRNKIDSEEAVSLYFEEICRNLNPDTVCIINDYPEIAQKFKTYCHLGQSDKNVVLHKNFGRSTHSIPEVRHALQENPKPEYIGFGAMFSSPTKPEVAPQFRKLAEVRKLWDRDLVLIGGINLENVDRLPGGNNIYYGVISDFFNSGLRFSDIEKRTFDLIQKCTSQGALK